MTMRETRSSKSSSHSDDLSEINNTSSEDMEEGVGHNRSGSRTPVVIKSLYPTLPTNVAKSPGVSSPNLKRRGNQVNASPQTPSASDSQTSSDISDYVLESASLETPLPKRVNYVNATSKTEKRKEDQGSSLGIVLLTILLAISIAGILYYLNQKPMITHTGSAPYQDVLKSFESDFGRFEGGFKQQNVDTIIGLKAAIKSVMKEKEPREPACVMLIGEKESEQTTSCVANTLFSMVKTAFAKLPPPSEENTPQISHVEIKRVSSGNITHFLEAKAYPVANGESHLMLMLGLEGFPPESARFFHTYCDNDYAPVKRLVMLITVNLPSKDIRNLDVADPQNIDVYGMWKNQVNLEKLSALESRIGNNRVFLAAETMETIRQFC